MRVFVTGASGHIASAVVPELITAGHEVTGLARSETSAAAVKALGAEVRRGDTSDLDGLREAAASADAVIHLAFNHDVMAAGDMAGAAAMDMVTVQAFGGALAGTGKTFIGIGIGNAAANRWPAVHTLDLGRLYRLALEKAPAGSLLIAAAEEGIAVRDIAEVIGRHLGIRAVSVAAGKAAEHFGPFWMVMTLGIPPMSNASSRQLLGWEPDHPGLIADLDQGHYFAGQ
jgi:nucleoside-diphosphate-sugar epimerase